MIKKVLCPVYQRKTHRPRKKWPAEYKTTTPLARKTLTPQASPGHRPERRAHVLCLSINGPFLAKLIGKLLQFHWGFFRVHSSEPTSCLLGPIGRDRWKQYHALKWSARDDTSPRQYRPEIPLEYGQRWTYAAGKELPKLSLTQFFFIGFTIENIPFLRTFGNRTRIGFQTTANLLF